MPSQNNPGLQFDKTHAVTIVATAAVAARRLIAYDGGYATNAGGAKDVHGVSEHAAEIGEAVSCITHYSALVEAGAEIAFGDYIKPGANGKAAVGTAQDHCGRALGAASGDGALFEMQVLRQIKAAPPA